MGTTWKEEQLKRHIEVCKAQDVGDQLDKSLARSQRPSYTIPRGFPHSEGMGQTHKCVLAALGITKNCDGLLMNYKSVSQENTSII